MRKNKKRVWLWVFALMQMMRASVAMAADRPVVLELFTSQGCSSCPPADALLSGLAKDTSVLPLSFHVNYWDHLGWKDPYSSPEATKRQYAYAHAMASEQVFTPQMIVDGGISVVGSDAHAVHSAIGAARGAAAPAAEVSFSRTDGENISVSVAGAPAGADVWIIYFVRHADTDVQRGENGGRRLSGANIVTDMRRMTSVDAEGKGAYQAAMPREGLAVLVQTAGQGKIVGAGSFFR